MKKELKKFLQSLIERNKKIEEAGFKLVGKKAKWQEYAKSTRNN